MFRFLKNFVRRLGSYKPSYLSASSRGLLTQSDKEFDDNIPKWVLDIVLKPEVLINIGQDCKFRGDTAGRIGLGKALARLVGNSVLYADEAKLDKLYPKHIHLPYKAKLEKYLRESRVPDIVIGKPADSSIISLTGECFSIQQYADVNESMNRDLIGEEEIVAHHLTSDVLEEAGAEFDTYYPLIKKPIITIMLASQDGEVDIFVEKLINIVRHYPEATIFLCGGRRNCKAKQERTERLFIEKLKDYCLEDRVDLVSYVFESNKYNPYKGLIARSDNFIIWGSSYSLVSEALMAGKTLYLYNVSNPTRRLKERGCVEEFTSCAIDSPFKPKYFRPINLTDDMARVILNQFIKRRKHDIKLLLQSLKHKNFSKEWINLLIIAKYKPEYLKGLNVPYDVSFIRQALKLNINVAQYLDPSILIDKELSRELISNYPAIFQYLPSELLDDEDFIFSCEIDLTDKIEFLSERLRSKRSLVVPLLKHNPDLFPFLGHNIRSDPETSLYVIKQAKTFQQAKSYYHACSEGLKDDIQFIGRLIKCYPELYEYIPEKIKKNPNITFHAVMKNGLNYFHIPEMFRHDQELALLAITQNHALINKIPSELVSNKIFFKRALLTNAQILTASSVVKEHSYHDDEEIMLLAVQINPEWYQVASERLKNDVAFTRKVKSLGVMNILEKAGEKIKEDFAFIMECIRENPESYMYASTEIQLKPEVAEYLIENDIANLNMLNCGVLERYEFMSKLLHEKWSEVVSKFNIIQPWVWSYIFRHNEFSTEFLTDEMKKDKSLMGILVQNRPDLKADAGQFNFDVKGKYDFPKIGSETPNLQENFQYKLGCSLSEKYLQTCIDDNTNLNNPFLCEPYLKVKSVANLAFRPPNNTQSSELIFIHTRMLRNH